MQRRRQAGPRAAKVEHAPSKQFLATEGTPHQGEKGQDVRKHEAWGQHQLVDFTGACMLPVFLFEAVLSAAVLAAS